ncbi:unnamed protein product, partial [Meganyctiphanes norvegica]
MSEHAPHFPLSAVSREVVTVVALFTTSISIHMERSPVEGICTPKTTVAVKRCPIRYRDNFCTRKPRAKFVSFFVFYNFFHLGQPVFIHNINLKFVLGVLTRAPCSNIVIPCKYKGKKKLKYLSIKLKQTVQPIWRDYQKVKSEGRLLWVTYTTLSDYLWLLRAATVCLQERAPKALLYLAAAVSDFYIPPDQMQEHKIQSSGGALTVQLQLVPKMLQPLVSVWGPELFVVSFKLETDEKMLIDKAQGALQKYKHDLVIGNLLKTRREEVTFVTQKESSLLRLTEHQKSQNIEIEKLIIDEVVSRHRTYIRY